MATRATIQIANFGLAKVYKHWDGYPEATLPWLEQFNREFSEARGFDPSYKFAQLLRSSAFDSEQFGLDDSRGTGWGVVHYDTECGEQYRYILHTDGTVTYEAV